MEENLKHGTSSRAHCTYAECIQVAERAAGQLSEIDDLDEALKLYGTGMRGLQHAEMLVARAERDMLNKTDSKTI